MGMNKIRIQTERVVKEAVLTENETAEILWEALPLEGRVHRWGDEIYFDIPVEVAPAADARADMNVGELAYWPPGQAFCIFWGPTPASTGPEPRAASPVNVFGKIDEMPADLGAVRDGETIRIERVE